jgi:hypothetical protein
LGIKIYPMATPTRFIRSDCSLFPAISLVRVHQQLRVLRSQLTPLRLLEVQVPSFILIAGVVLVEEK